MSGDNVGLLTRAVLRLFPCLEETSVVPVALPPEVLRVRLNTT